jgi:hypothetical protein
LSPEIGLRKTAVIRELTRSPHGKLSEYVPVGRQAASSDPDFFAHLIAWNEKRGQVRDAKVALPILALSNGVTEPFRENALAHLAKLDPRNFVRALDFAREVKTPGHGRTLRRLVDQYVRAREANWAWWERSVLQHRASMKTLYARYHLKPGKAEYQVILNRRSAKGLSHALPPTGTVFETVRLLPMLAPGEAATAIVEQRIPFLVAVGAIGKRLKEDDALCIALLERMSPTEVVTNTKMFERLGVRTRPGVRSAFESALARVAESKTTSFKTTKAAEAVESEALRTKLRAAQEKQVEKLDSVEGNWLVLGDKSGSMEHSIEVARQVAAALARVVKGEVQLVFFDQSPHYVEATGKTLDQLLEATKYVQAEGATSVGCGLQYAVDRGFDIDGIAIVSDAEENRPPLFASVYARFAAREGKTPPIYLYRVFLPAAERAKLHRIYGPGFLDRDTLTPSIEKEGFDVQVFELSPDFDYYSLPNLVQTMRANRYSLLDEIRATPLLTLRDVFRGGTPA